MKVEHFQAIADALLKKHYGIDLGDVFHLENPTTVAGYIAQGVRPYQVVADHADETDLVRIDKTGLYGVHTQTSLTAADEDDAIGHLRTAGILAGEEGKPPANIPVISTLDAYPFFLTDRFGEWQCSTKAPPLVKELCVKFIDAFGNEPGPLKPGDPRAFMGGNETTFLVVKDGRFGVLSEIELGIAEEGDPNQTARPSEWVNAEDFAARLQEWSRALNDLAPAYPGSEFFLAHGEPTFDGRLSLEAFTPVEVGWGCACQDPYRAQGKSIERLDEAMNALAYAAPCTLEYNRIGTDGDVTTGLETSARIYAGSAKPRVVTEHFLDGEIAAGDVIPTGVVYGNKQYNVACNGDEITAVGDGRLIDSHTAADRPAPRREAHHAPR
jgi:hypothetical protein